MDQHGHDMYYVHLVGGFYEVNFRTAEPVRKMMAGQLWHLRLGHAGFKTVTETMKGTNPRMKIEDWTYEVCKKSNLQKKSHSKRYGLVGKTNRTTSRVPFEKLVVDTVVVVTVGYFGKKYLSVITDRATRWRDVIASPK